MKPYRVQAWKKGQFTQWFTDSEAETLPQAVSAAEVLHREWDRKVRVIDAQTGQVLFQRPPRQRRGRSEEL